MSNFFERAQQAGNTYAPYLEQERDSSAIGKIMAQASEQGNQGPDFDALMGQILQRVSPTNRQAAINILENKRNAMMQQNLNKIYAQQADRLEQQYPNSPYNQGLANIYKSDIPPDKKAEMAKNYIDSSLKSASVAAFQTTQGMQQPVRPSPQAPAGGVAKITDIQEEFNPNQFSFEDQVYDIPEIKTPQLKNVPSESDIKNISLALPQQAKILQEQRNAALKPQQFGQKEESKIVGDFLKDVEKKRSTIASKEMALRGINDAISRQTNFDSLRAQLADYYDVPALRSLTGAELNSRVKELYIEDLARFKNARPNQFLEKMLSSALVDPRNTPGANKIVNVASNAQLEMEKAEIKVKDDLAEFYRNRDGYVPAAISKEADRILAPIRQKIMDKAAYDTRLIVEENMTDKQLKKLEKVPQGTYLTPRMQKIIEEEFKTPRERANAAKNLGYARFRQ